MPEEEVTATEVENSGGVVTGEESATSDDKGGLQQRFSELTAQRREALEENARLRGQIEGMQISQQGPVVPQTPQQAIAPEMFDTDAEYQAALTQSITADVMQSVNQNNAVVQQQKQMEKRVSQVMEAAKGNPDIVQMANDPSMRMSDTMLGAADGPRFAQVYHFLGKNRGEHARIMSLTPAQQAKEIGIIEARLVASPKKKSQSKAPDPSESIATDGGSSVVVTDPNRKAFSENMASWAKARRERLGAA